MTFSKFLGVICFLASFVVCASDRIFCQSSNTSIFDIEKMKGASAALSSESVLKSDAPPNDVPVDPAHFRVGPGDVYVLYRLSGLETKEELLVVSPENTLFIPRFGEIRVSGMTLETLRDTVLSLHKHRTENLSVGFSLKKPRTILVSVRGNVLNVGTYTVPASYRVSSVLRLAQSPSKNSTSADEFRSNDTRKATQDFERNLTASSIVYLSTYSTRNVSVRHVDGSTDGCDLEKAILFTGGSSDPCVREGDEIFVPFEPFSYATISSAGAVQRSRTMAYKSGDKASFLLRASGGLQSDADVQSLRLLSSNGTEEKLSFSPISGVSNDRELKPGNVLMVNSNRESDLSRSGVVVVSGNVVKPGSFPIQLGKTRLKDVIERAGGFTPEAFLPLSHILRKNPTQVQQFTGRQDRMYSLFASSPLNSEDTLRFQLDFFYSKPMVSSSFEECFVKNSDIDNAVLVDGDEIIVASNPHSVYVFGQVNRPGFVEFVQGKSFEWYVGRAGGFAEKAEIKRAKLIRGRTNSWLEATEDLTVYSGDNIYVPHPPEVSSTMEIQSLSAITGIYTGIAGLLLGIVNTYIFSTR